MSASSASIAARPNANAMSGILLAAILTLVMLVPLIGEEALKIKLKGCFCSSYLTCAVQLKDARVKLLLRVSIHL